MSQTKGISVSVDVDLHSRAKAEQERLELTMNQFIALVIEEHFKKEGKIMSEKTRTLAFQVSEDLFQRVKEHLARNPKLSQREFVISLIEQALDAAEAALPTEEGGAESTSDQPTDTE